MAQELPAIAVAPGAAPKVKQSNEQQGGTEQLDAFRNALQSAIGGQTPEAGKATAAPAARKSGGKEIPKEDSAKDAKDTQKPDATNVLQILANQVLGVSSLDLVALLAKGIGNDASSEGKVAVVDQQTGVPAQTSPTSQGATVQLDGAQTPVVLAQPVVDAAALADDAVKALASLMTSDVPEDSKAPTTSTDTPPVATAKADGKEIPVPMMPVQQLETAAPEKKPVAPAKDEQQTAPLTKEQPAVGKSPSLVDHPDVRTAAKEPAVPAPPSVKIQSEVPHVVASKVQASPITSEAPAAPKSLQPTEASQPAPAPQTTAEVAVKQTAVIASQVVDRIPTQHESPAQAKSVAVPTEKQPTIKVEEDRSSQDDPTLSDGSGKKDSTASSAPQARAAAEPDHTNTFTIPRSAVSPADVRISTPTVSDSGKAPQVTLPNPLPRELSRSVLDQVVKGMTISVTDTTQEVRVTLKPESLGDVVVKMKMEDGHLQAQIDVAQPAVKATVESQIADLRQALQDRGIDVQRIDVVAASQSSNVADGQTQRGGKYKQKGGRRQESLDALDEVHQARSLGYNTLEVIM